MFEKLQIKKINVKSGSEINQDILFSVFKDSLLLNDWIQYRKGNYELKQFDNNGAGLDALMFLIAAKNQKKIAYIKKPQVFFRIHEDSFTVKNEFNEVISIYFEL